MSRFERLLALQVVAVLAGCTGGEPEPEAWCDGELPEGYAIEEGYVKIEVGGTCPDAADVEVLSSFGCPGSSFQGEVCGFVEVREERVLTPYGGSTSPGGTGYVFDPEPGDLCIYEGVFEPITDAVCGRPLLEGGVAVLAGTRARRDWADRPLPDVAGIGDAARGEAGAYWLEAARMEHASVASFARFAMELVRFGAPPELLVDAQRAGLDEVEHARLCFALAGAYLGQEVGPDAVELGEAAQLAPTRVAFAEAVLLEGCIGETLAVMDAAARLAGATDPAVRAVLATVIDDEGRHAALAWRTLAWLLEDDADGALSSHLEGILEAARPAWVAGTGLGDEADHGLLSDARRGAVLRDGFDRVVRPAWAAVVGHEARTTRHETAFDVERPGWWDSERPNLT